MPVPALFYGHYCVINICLLLGLKQCKNIQCYGKKGFKPCQILSL